MARVRNTDPREEVREAVRAAPAEKRERKRKGTTDKYWIDPRKIPTDWSYEWKRKTVMGQIDIGYDTELLEQGWTPVPVERHAEMMPKDWKGDIMRDGLVLMERPMALTREATLENDEAARDQIRRREQMNGETPQGTKDLPRTAPVIKGEFASAISVPKD